MRKPSRAGGIAVGALAVALAAGAFAVIPASAAVTMVTARGCPHRPPRHPAEGRRRKGGRGRASGHHGHQPCVCQLGRVCRQLRDHYLPLRVGAIQRAFPELRRGYRRQRRMVLALGRTGRPAVHVIHGRADRLARGCNGTTPVYIPFWEMFPNGPGYPGIAVHPGDAISLAVFYNKPARGKFTLAFSAPPTASTSPAPGPARPAPPAYATAPRRSARHPSIPPHRPSCRWPTSRPQVSAMSPSPTPPARTAAGCSPRTGTPTGSPRWPATAPTSPSPEAPSLPDPSSTARPGWPSSATSPTSGGRPTAEQAPAETQEPHPHRPDLAS